MTEFELELLNTLKEHERTTKENLELIEKLQYDLEKAKYEKIKVLAETSAAIEVQYVNRLWIYMDIYIHGYVCIYIE
jgi:hypothetical protein